MEAILCPECKRVIMTKVRLRDCVEAYFCANCWYIEGVSAELSRNEGNKILQKIINFS